MGVVDELQAAVAEVAQRVGPATVRIGRDGRGAGVVLGEGRVLTNAHNLRGATTTVTFAGGRGAEGEVVGLDGDGDPGRGGRAHRRRRGPAVGRGRTRDRCPGAGRGPRGAGPCG